MRTAVFRGRFQPTERSAAFERIYMKAGIVMEGGAMRGMFTAGVIDVLMENDISFDGCLWTELNILWLQGIKTIGSCCGHHYNSPKNTA